jgi:hypothetical protein
VRGSVAFIVRLRVSLDRLEPPPASPAAPAPLAATGDSQSLGLFGSVALDVARPSETESEGRDEPERGRER